MKILNVILSLDPAGGGPPEGLRQNLRSRAFAAHEVEIVCGDRPGEAYHRGWPCPIHALGPRTRRYGYTPGLVPWLKANAPRFDAVVVHGVWNYVSLATWLGLRGSGTPFFIFTHGMLDPWFRRAYPLKHWVKQAFWWAIEGRVLEAARCVLFTAEDEQRLARTAYAGHGTYRSRIVGYGTSDVVDAPEAQVSAFHKAMPALAAKPFLLFLSRLHAKKGCDLLIEAFAAISFRYPELQLVIAGPDQMGWQGALQARAVELGIASRVHWPGMLTGDAKWGAFRSAEAFVLPSHSENFGVVVAESLACGTPVLITDKVNIWREIVAAGAGVAVEDNQAAVTGMLEQFLSLDRAARDKMKAATRPCFLAHFEIEAASEALLRTLADLSGQAGRSDAPPTEKA